ncbi:uncharacterized protein LOC113316123 [Papaver somniferum]|uniref:uncharacterized protein LOC113316123 n=1 Tax=Papaver somniferum TaxID=3469 RepID=UPI000E7054A1|nr:uncharacterized protein LOC113316123 [Papaver somniferum]
MQLRKIPCRAVNRANAPPSDVLTINYDGSYQDLNKSGGIGLIIQTFVGIHQAARCIHLKDIRNAEQAECMWLWEVVNCAKTPRIEKVYFELDAKVVVDAVNNTNSSIDWRLHNIIKDIKLLLKSFTSWKCSYIPKEGNKVVDILSKLARVDS